MIQTLHRPRTPHSAAERPPSNVGSAVHALLELMKARDPALLRHSLAVARLATDIAAALDLPRIDAVRRAALLHDVGKLTLPDSVLNKPAPLSASEYRLVREHPIASCRMSVGLGLRQESSWVLHHHERPDGLGYPGGLGEGQIPLEAEVIHVADVYDALTTARPYRPSMPRTEALCTIVDGSGRDFNRECVSALVAVS